MKNIFVILLVVTASYTANAQWVKLNKVNEEQNVTVYFKDKTMGWICSVTLSDYDNNVLHTTNGGNNWSVSNQLKTRHYFNGTYINFVSKDEGYFNAAYDFDNQQAAFESVDGGKNWQKFGTKFGMPLFATLNYIKKFNDGSYIVYLRSLPTNNFSLIKINANNTVDTISINKSHNQLTFIDANIAYAINGNVISGQPNFSKSIDGGKNWNTLGTGTNKTISSFYFTDAFHGVAVGEGSLILHTSNGGLTWKNVSFAKELNYNKIVFTTPKVGYICGQQGVMLKTIDGGLTWNTMQSGTFENLRAISFPDSTVGYCVGDNGTILKLIEDPTVPQVVSITPPTGVLCAGATYKLGYTVNKKFEKSNVFVAHLSDAAGEFGNSSAIGTAISDTSGTINITIPSNTPRNFGYRIRLQSSAPSAVSATNENFIEIQPSIQLAINVTKDKGIICQGDVVNFSAMLFNGGNNPQISWYNHSTPIGKGLKFAYQPKDKDLINIYGKSSLACAMPDSIKFNYPVQCVTEAPTLVIPEAMYIVIKTPTTPTITAVGNELTSSATKGNQWYKGDEKIPNATAQSYTATQAGQYKVLVNDGACPPMFSAATSVIISGTLSSEQLQLTLTLYPNPAGEELTIESNLGIEKIKVYNSNGVKVLESNYVPRLSVSQLSQGLYLLEAIGGNGNSVRSKFEKR